MELHEIPSHPTMLYTNSKPFVFTSIKWFQYGAHHDDLKLMMHFGEVQCNWSQFLCDFDTIMAWKLPCRNKKIDSDADTML